MKKILGSSRGQIAVLYAGILVALLGAVALCTDVAVMYVNWQQAQKVADAAAMSGANFLTGIAFTGTVDPSCTGQPDSASQAACTYAVDNGLAASTVTISEPTASTIRVVAQETGLPYFFGKVVGLSTYTVGATAVAQASQPPITSNIFPVGLQCGPTAPPNCTASSPIAGQPLTFGKKFVGVGASGNWQFLDVSGGHGGGDPLLAAAIEGTAPAASFTAVNADGSCPSGNCTIISEPGNKGKSGPVKTAFDDRMKSCPNITDPCGPGGNPEAIPSTDPCLVTVPVVNFAGCNGSCSLTIEGFADVYLEPTSTSTSMTGCYVRAVDPNSTGSPGALALGPMSPPVLIQ